MHNLTFDIAHLLAGSLVVMSFVQLYQDRLSALINVFALHALVLALSVAWQAFAQEAPHLYITAVIALVFKAIIIPVALRRIMVRLGIHREIETVVGIGLTMLAGIGLVALSMVVMLRVTADADPLTREDLAFALSVVLLGLLMMVTRRNAVSQVIGFMSIENGLVLAATGAKGMPLVVEISVAFSILPGYWLSARLNILATLLTFLAAISLIFARPKSGLYILIDDLNIVFIVLTTLVAFTTSAFSA